MDLLVEQLVYGSFPFWDRGYDVLGCSPGCSPKITAEVVATCRKFGQPPSGDSAKPAMFAVRLRSGPWTVVGVKPQGDDDRGRPGALAFHALIVSAEDHARTRFNPFGYTHRSKWSLEDSGTLPRVRCSVERIAASGRPADSGRVGPIVEALRKRRRVAVEASEPIDGLAREVWASLPERVRSRASVATWAFSGENRFDLVAFPRLVGVALDDSYVLPTAPEVESKPVATEPRTQGRGRGRTIALAGGALGLAVLGLAGWIWWMSPGKSVEESSPAALTEAVAEPPILGPAEVAQLQPSLAILAGRLEGFEVGPSTDPGLFLTKVAEAVHYHGRILTADELDRIARDPDPDKARALAWHAQIRGFVDDRPLPSDFASTPLAGQLALVARSFHLDPSTRPVAVVDALIAALARPGLIRPTPLAARFPALSDYARFLGKLPRLDDPP